MLTTPFFEMPIWGTEMAEDADFHNGREPPRRFINKQNAIRHLLHVSIRLVMKQEDPFAIHLCIHSADKMILDVAKARGEYPRVDWELYIKDEYHEQFFKQHREIYNYFKHAKKDFGDDLPVRDIMMLNIMTLFIAIANYVALFKEHTDHMMLFNVFVMNLSPAIIGQDFPNRDEFLKNISMSQTMTPRVFFDTFEQNTHMLPRFGREVADDLQDTIHFYNLSFLELRAGRIKSTRVFHLPEK
jgi:hypothetical protein